MLRNFIWLCLLSLLSVTARADDAFTPGVWNARAEADRVRHDQMRVREATFRHEPVDRRWASDATDALQAALASDAIVQPALRRLACRAQTCRVELAGDATGELTQALPMVLHQMDETFAGATAHYVEDGAGGQTIILYIARRAREARGQ